MDKQEKIDALKKYREQGMTLEEAGNKLSFSRQRAWQLLNGYRYRGPHQAAYKRFLKEME